ncbi:LIM and SH3 domain protein Lasp-like isoform X4 [Leptotrombidium deliense]|uniref:LIM and SH3 domain protein Lasp-like isoform X4 n=1 Tax=Leptotrombidium deliense TaxID=299467 RepID=A0A443SNF2_9ACAR|nr:LIM and SH3 domain protein Lasp-like isoform X4 [Leptotrombidium deliense]
MNKCVHCEKSISSNEELKCLDKIWTQGYCKCQECGVPLNMKTYKEYSKMSLEKSTKFGSSDLTNPSINGHRLPSYVGISCVISGYSNYSKFCASTRPTYTRGYSSPTIRVDSKECAEVNSSRDKSSFEEKKVISNNSVSEKECVEVSNGEVKEKSLVQQKIESLYGKSFASGWRHSRLKQKNSKHNGESAQHRSPSCPPGMLQTRLDTKGRRNIPIL